MPRTLTDRLEQLSTLVLDKGRGVFAFVLVLHGAAHLVGTRGAMQAVDNGPLEYLFGAWSIDSPWLLYTIAAVWTVISAGFAVAGWLVYMAAISWQRMLWTLAIASLAMSVVALPIAWIGVVINIVLLGLSWSPVAIQSDRTAAYLR